MRNGRAVLESINGRPARFALPRELLATDRVLQRWAVSIGSGLPSDEFDDRPAARPVPLPDDLAILVDQCICRAPKPTRRLLVAWYKSPKPAELIAADLGISRRNVYVQWRIVLEFMRLHLRAIDDPTLSRLLRAID